MCNKVDLAWLVAPHVVDVQKRVKLYPPTGPNSAPRIVAFKLCSLYIVGIAVSIGRLYRMGNPPPFILHECAHKTARWIVFFSRRLYLNRRTLTISGLLAATWSLTIFRPGIDLTCLLFWKTSPLTWRVVRKCVFLFLMVLRCFLLSLFGTPNSNV